MKVVDQRNLPQERPASMDETGKRVFIFPAQVEGVWRRRRTITEIFLVIFFLVLPWIKIGGHQALLLDIAERRFSVFGLTFWAHDAPLVFFILAFLTIGLAFVTAVWGRVWCGWACPQTVFIDGVFRRLEYLIIGSHIQQRNLARAPWDLKKFFKLGLLWTLFLVASLIIAHSFLAYFVGAEKLVDMTQHNPHENWTIFVAMAFITAVLLFDFGWFREQFCIIMCPYGKFQSTLMDDDSITVTYDSVRGEPRKGMVKPGEREGDCINCYKCVAVCPTGIDIRNGQQLECIGCTACIDACDEVMDKIEKPRGLIRYAAGNALKGIKTRLLRPRVAIYSVLLVAVVSALVFSVSRRQDLAVTVLRGKDTPFQVIQNPDGSEQVINHFKMSVKNQTFNDVTIKTALPEELKAKGAELVTQSDTINLGPGENLTVHFFVKFPRGLIGKGGTGAAPLELIDPASGEVKAREELHLVGPGAI
ncbi:MAG TPA: cytochrome c oxidase accessory protein CcoG [Thermodesulfobacteriota bacterium]|nr:cytochrome c oxidase accessory protein CcoG [Thermodesulfobacteriota bacterium]